VIIDKVLSELYKKFNNKSIMITKNIYLLAIKVIASTIKNKKIFVDTFSSICISYNQILNKEDIVRKYEQIVKSNNNLILLDKNLSIVLNA
jgi:hypothetical protein